MHYHHNITSLSFTDHSYNLNPIYPNNTPQHKNNGNEAKTIPQQPLAD